MSDPYKDATDLAREFGRYEYALKRSGFLRSNPSAMADWNAFARELGSDFFDVVCASGKADTLIHEPPRKLMNQGLKWLPENPEPLRNVVELFEIGVCRVRNSLVHGEKFTASCEQQRQRDERLVSEALFVLRLSGPRIIRVKEIIELNSSGESDISSK
ncbi:hypothetical protein [Methylobacterium sp. D54C]